MVTPESVAKAKTSKRPWQGMAENRKVDEAVDQQISQNDPAFRGYLKEIQANLEKSYRGPSIGRSVVNLIAKL